MQLEKSREAVDAANLRAAYAEVMTGVVSGDETVTKTVTQTQKEAKWETTFDFPDDFNVTEPTGTSGTWTVKYDKTVTDKKPVLATYTAGK